jgi:Protein of unknown function (DUF669)
VSIPIEGGFANIPVGFQPMDKGVYEAEVTNVEVKTAKEGAKYPGSQYLAWEFTVDDSAYPDYQGRKQWLNTVLVPSARPRLKEFLVGVGYTDEELNDPNFEFEPTDIIGRRCSLMVVVGTNPKTDEPNNSVRRVMPVGSTESASLPT